MILLALLLFNQTAVNARLLAEYAGRDLTVGDPFEITVEVSGPQEYQFSEPVPDSLPFFAILNKTNKIIQQKGHKVSTYRIKLCALAAGDLTIPPFRSVFQSSGAQPETLQSAAVPVKIVSVLPPDMKDINDVKKMIDFPNLGPALILAGLIALAGLAYLGRCLYQRWGKTTVSAAPRLMPWEEALTSIEALNRQDLIHRGLIKQYYYSLSEILKRYLERRFEFNATEQTTTEIINVLKQRKTPGRDEFGRFFTSADLVKYAKHIPDREEIESAAEQAKNLVIQTKPAEPSTAAV